MSDVDFLVNPEVYEDSDAKKEFVYEVNDRFKRKTGVVVELGSSPRPASEGLSDNPNIHLIGIDKDARDKRGRYDIVNGDLALHSPQEILGENIDNKKISGIVASDILGYLPNWNQTLNNSVEILDSDGDIMIFHRVNRGWDEELSSDAPKSPKEIEDALKQSLGSRGKGSVESYRYDQTKDRFVSVKEHSNLDTEEPHMFILHKG